MEHLITTLQSTIQHKLMLTEMRQHWSGRVSLLQLSMAEAKVNGGSGEILPSEKKTETGDLQVPGHQHIKEVIYGKRSIKQ